LRLAHEASRAWRSPVGRAERLFFNKVLTRSQCDAYRSIIRKPVSTIRKTSESVREAISVNA
jgi:hypothetical protein